MSEFFIFFGGYTTGYFVCVALNWKSTEVVIEREVNIIRQRLEMLEPKQPEEIEIKLKGE